jgi:hypothetical protein
MDHLDFPPAQIEDMAIPDVAVIVMRWFIKDFFQQRHKKKNNNPGNSATELHFQKGEVTVQFQYLP